MLSVDPSLAIPSAPPYLRSYFTLLYLTSLCTADSRAGTIVCSPPYERTPFSPQVPLGSEPITSFILR